MPGQKEQQSLAGHGAAPLVHEPAPLAVVVNADPKVGSLGANLVGQWLQATWTWNQI